MLLPTKPRTEVRTGLAVVEFAVIAPILVFVTLGMLEMARGMMVKEIMTDAARKGCRTGLLLTGSNAAVTSDVNAVLTNNNITASDATIQITVNGSTADVSTAPAGAKISVKVSIPVSKVAWITPLFLPGQSIESEAVVMMSQK